MTHHLLITGSSRGIGRGLVDHFLKKKHCHLHGISRSPADFAHERYTHHAFDLSELNALKEEAVSLLPKISDGDAVTLVNNAGLLGDIGHLGSIKAQTFREVMDVNVTALAMLMNAFIGKYARHNGRKVILNISSGAGKSPVDGWAAYCASKAAADMLSEVAARECALDKNGIRIFAVAPGVVDTEMQTQIRSADASGFSNLQRFLDLKNEGQLSSAEDVAEKLAKVIERADDLDAVLLDVRALNDNF